MKTRREKPCPPVAHVGIDWSEDHHDVSFCEEGGFEERQSIRIGSEPEELEEFFDPLMAQFPEGKIAVYVEKNRIGLRYFLMRYERLDQYLIPTTSLKNYRETFQPSGAKSDEADSELILDLGFRHRNKYRKWQADSVEIRQLQTLVEDRRKLVEKKKALLQQLGQALKRYYPQARKIFPDLDRQVAWKFLQRWTRLEQLKRVQSRTLEKWLRQQKCRNVTQRVEEIQQILQGAVAMTTDVATIEAMVLRVQSLTTLLQTHAAIIRQYEEKIAEIHQAQSEASIFDSFPGAGCTMAPRLVALWGTDRDRFQDSQEANQWTGIAPVKVNSGKHTRIEFRRGCSKFLRQTMHEFAGISIRYSDWANAHYKSQRALGKEHHCAVRSVAFKWTRIMFRCWKDSTPYREEKHLQALTKRRSPVLKFHQAGMAP